ncbi:MAG: MBL fold metallo-hydrolase [Kangiellaceae bacterium]|nr:MBL fold metallo-hydrolase [Kangiellaceae bacterium]
MSIRQHYQFENVLGRKVGRFNLGLNTQFIVYRIGDTVFDTGPSNQWRHVKSFITQSPVKKLLLTHHHEDHSGNAQRIASLCKLIPRAPALSQKKLNKGYPTPLIQKIIWGSPKRTISTEIDDIEYLSDGNPIYPIATPGHAKDLTCYHLPVQGYFFSGDLFIARKLKLLRSDENLQQLVDSLRKAIALDFKTMFCPHGGVVENGKSALQSKLDYILNLCDKTQTMYRQGTDTHQIMIELLGPEDAIGKISRGNLSRRNLIEQCKLVELATTT